MQQQQHIGNLMCNFEADKVMTMITPTVSGIV